MTIKEYQNLAMRTNDGECTARVSIITDEFFRRLLTVETNGTPIDPGELLNGALGLTGEAGEVSDMIKKHIFHGHDLNRDELVKELGDCAWYLALLCNAIGISLEDVLITNIEKLKRRYPEGFSSEASINRTE